jgi:hypothetical protein
MAPKIGTRKDGTPRKVVTPRGRRPLGDLDVERLRQRLDEATPGLPPLSARYRRKARQP